MGRRVIWGGKLVAGERYIFDEWSFCRKVINPRNYHNQIERIDLRDLSSKL